MAIKNVFGKGKSYYGKGSSRLNVPSDEIDRRKKEHKSYRSSNPVEGEIIMKDGKTMIKFEDGRIEETSVL